MELKSQVDAYLPAIASGDPDAFASWVAVAEPRIRGSLKSFARSVDTEAVMQECLLRVWQVAPRFEPDGKPDGLIRLGVRIARNLALTEVRRRRPGSITAAMLAEMEVDETVAAEPDPELRSIIRRCLEKLPMKPRLAIDARMAMAGLPDEALAKSVRMKPNTFLQNIRRARITLAECLEQNGIQLAGRS